MIRSPRRSARTSRVALAALVTAGGLLVAGCAAGQQAQTAEQYPTVDGANGEVGSLALRNVALIYPENGVYRKGSTARLRLLIANTGNRTDTLTEVRTEVAGEAVLVANASPSPTASSPSSSDTLTPTATASSTASSTASGTPSGTASQTPSATASGTPSATASGAPSGTASGTPSGSASATGSATPSTSPAVSPSETGALPSAPVTILPNNSVSIGEGTSNTGIELRGLTQDLRSSQVVSITFVFRNAGAVTLPVPVAIPEEREPAPTIPAESEE